jgi:lipopolysaccharide heptosyltransferase II
MHRVSPKAAPATMEGTLPERVLIVRLGAIGDVVNATALATALRRRAPHVRIGWAVHELARPLVDGHPSIDRAHVWARGGGVAGFRRVVREIRGERYVLAIDLQRLAKSALLARCSGAPRVLGFDRARAKEWSWLLTREHVAPADRGAHMVSQYMEFARYLGLSDEVPPIELPRDSLAREQAAALVQQLGDPPVVIHVGASKPANRWLPERFGELARACIDEFDLPVCLTGGPDDRERAAIAKSACRSDRCRDLAGATTLLELAELQRASSVCVSCDSGPMHLAAAAGARVVALFGAADPRRTGPWGAGHRVVRTLPPCAPCNRRDCSQPRHVCMEDLGVDRALDAVREVLGRAQSPAPKSPRSS